ncbi:squalene/phytoene synthase family protein [Paeniglutamicibacter antarcticus]|uniref:Squalene/phytoene synthase family protein n=1 Tax=Arthrobacter terrae TaxID=2935737 RepID=A0A931G8F6_9MICC|nr:squalene/phytoene synthase family protein [Arthrobacter terrae]MBG0740189.1 squalene/phytoene synthase family protein [Arthrobacter terrae]
MVTASSEFYDQVAAAAASVVIKRYSTSFGFASRLLGKPIRQHVENVYALVRIADEVVDGAAASTEGGVAAIGRQLDVLEAECMQAMACGYSTNLVVHAFASTARAAGFGAELTSPFFRSMRADLAPVPLTEETFKDYVYGSAEVVGLMCLRVFLIGQPAAEQQYAALADGARRLGAAFQKINFLRDLTADFHELKRSYFPGIDPTRLTDSEKDTLLDNIDADLAASAAAISALPANSIRAVRLAHALFTELSVRSRRTPAQMLLRNRLRVPDRVKLRIAASVVLGAPFGRPPVKVSA